MSPDLRGTRVTESPAKDSVRAGSGQSGGQDKPHIPLGTTMASELPRPGEGREHPRAVKSVLCVIAVSCRAGMVSSRVRTKTSIS